MNKSARFLIYLTFVYTCVEGLIINIRYPDVLAFIYKDIILLAVYLIVLLPDLGRFFSPSKDVGRLSLPLYFFFGTLCLYLLMPTRTSLMQELVAVKQRVFYIPLITIGYDFVRSERDLRRLFRFVVVTAIGVSLFGIYLYFTGPTGLRSLGAYYSAEVETAAVEGSNETYWRVPGTFTSAGQYGAYLQFCGLLAVSMLLTEIVSKRDKLIAAASLVLIILAMFTSGSRSPFILLTASVAMLLAASGRVTRAGAWGMAGYAILMYGFVFLGPGVRDRFGSIVSYEHVERFQTTYFGQMFLPGLIAEPLGSGLGVATIGARHFARELKDVDLVESYLAIIAAEVGVIGVVVFVWSMLTILAVVFSLRRWMARSSAKMPWYALASYVLFTALILPVSTSIDHAPTNFYFWFSIGVVVKLVDIERWKVWTVHTAQREISGPRGSTVVGRVARSPNRAAGRR